MATSDCNFQRHQAIDCAKLVVDEMLCEYNSLSEDLINMYYKMEKIVIWKNIKKELDCMQ